MKLPVLRPSERQALKARAHALRPVVMIGDAGLTDAVLREIERNLAAHELIKVRIAQDDRDTRAELCARIAEQARAYPVQRIGKLLVLFRPDPTKTASAGPPLRAAKPVRRPAPSSRGGRAPPSSGPGTPRRPNVERASRSAAGKGAGHPPRTDRVRKSGQRSSKKPFQDS